MKTRSYKELSRLHSFEERFEYLKLSGEVGAATFGFNRYLNQAFYKSAEWRSVRNKIITRDNGCDLGVSGFEIFDKIIIHHIIPITEEAIDNRDPLLLDMDNLISVSQITHNAIHYGESSLLPKAPIERYSGDTTLWKRK